MSRDFAGQYLYRTSPTVLDVGEPFTIACFVNLDSTAHCDFVSKYNGSSWIMGTYTGGQFGGYNGAWIVGPVTTAARTYHVAWVCAGGTGTLYQDGAVAASGGSGGQAAVAANFHVAVRSGGANLVDGRMAGIALWNAALNAREVAGLARGVSPLVTRPLSLLGYWPLWGHVLPEPDLSKSKLPLSNSGSPAAARQIAGGLVVL
jgi:hypothetical protein